MLANHARKHPPARLPAATGLSCSASRSARPPYDRGMAESYPCPNCGAQVSVGIELAEGEIRQTNCPRCGVALILAAIEQRWGWEIDKSRD